MQLINRKHISGLIFIIFFSLISWTYDYSLTLEISNIKSGKGKIVVELYNDPSNWFKSPFKRVIVNASDNEQKILLPVPYGKYAIVVYQDINENGKLDRGLFGIPKEPIGFGNNFKPIGRSPKFQECLITYDATTNKQLIKLYKIF